MNAANESPSSSRVWSYGLAVLAGVLRLVPHPPNFTPVGALGLYGGGRLPTWRAYVLPLGVMAASDVVLGLLRVYDGYPMFGWYTLFVYPSLLLNVVLGRLLCRTLSAWRIGGTTLLGSVQFFLVTNFGDWATSSLYATGTTYPPTPEGLLTCYIMGLPFFGYTLAGDLTFAAALFGAHAWLTNRAAAAEPARVTP